MPKQKVKASRKVAQRPAAGSEEHTPADPVPAKLEGKNKGRLRQVVSAALAPRRAKHAGKGKSKVPPETGGERAGTTMHKLGRRPSRLGRLERLELAIEEVRLGARSSPRTRKLQSLGVPKMAQKVIEEAGEVAIEALLGNQTALVAESVDLFYNTLVLLSGCGVTLDMIWGEMDRREVTLGMAEKLPKVLDPET